MNGLTEQTPSEENTNRRSYEEDFVIEEVSQLFNLIYKYRRKSDGKLIFRSIDQSNDMMIRKPTNESSRAIKIISI